MFNLDAITHENNKDHNRKWPYIPDHPYRIFIVRASRSRKANAFLNLIKQDSDGSLVDKIYFYAEDVSEPKYQFLIKKHGDVGIRNLNNPSAFIEYSNMM